MGGRAWRFSILAVVLAAAFYVLNPYWYSDAPWYAWDITAGRVDSGHLLWQASGHILFRVLRAAGCDVDPILLLRVMSSVGTVLLVGVTYRTAARFGLDRAGLPAAAIVALSQFALWYGGSGTPYSTGPALALAAISALAHPEGRPWSWGLGLASAGLMTLSWGTWGRRPCCSRAWSSARSSSPKVLYGGGSCALPYWEGSRLGRSAPWPLLDTSSLSPRLPSRGSRHGCGRAATGSPRLLVWWASFVPFSGSLPHSCISGSSAPAPRA